MLLRLALSLAVLLLLANHADAQVTRLRVVSEDASAIQCVAGACSTLQVTRSTFSTGAVETILFFSVYDSTTGDPLPSPFPFLFNQIPSEAFQMNRRGNTATLQYGGANVTWENTGRFSEITDSVRRVRDTRHPELHVEHSRLTDQEHLLEAAAQGSVGVYTFEPDASDPGNGFLRRARTLRIDKE